MPEFTTVDSVHVAVGYPEAGAAGQYVAGMVVLSDPSPLCLALADAGTSRRRRGADSHPDNLTREKRQTTGKVC